MSGDDLHLDAIERPGMNTTMKGPEGSGIRDIHAEISEGDFGKETGLTFKFGKTQQRMIDAGGNLRLSIHQVPMPPVGVRMEGPYCPEHKIETDWLGDRFACHRCNWSPDDGRDPEAQVRSEFKPSGDPE